MNTAARFLGYLAQAIAGITLYKARHPARERAIDQAFQWLMELQDEIPTPTFTFLGGEVLLDDWPLRSMRSWDWSSRMAAVGVQRVEFIGRVTREDFEAFLLELFERLVGDGGSTAEVRQGRPSNIRYGEVRMKGKEGGDPMEQDALPIAKLGYSLKEEIQGIQWIHEELQDQNGLHLLEASGVVRSLSVAMHSDQSYLIPLVRLKEYDQYTTTHALNVSVLTMALAESLGMAPREVRAFGMAGLLHDLGKVTIPRDILNKPGALSSAERAVMNSHTVEGARIIIRTEQDLDVAAVVAYEHHIRIDGGGYPSLMYERASHPASALVHVCDVFDALRTNRPYRDALPAERALSIIEEGSGSDFDEDVAHAFVQMMRKWENRIANVDPERPDVEVLATAKSEWADVEVYDMDADQESSRESPIHASTLDLDEPKVGGSSGLDAAGIEVFDLDDPAEDLSQPAASAEEVFDLDVFDEADEEDDDGLDWVELD